MTKTKTKTKTMIMTKTKIIRKRLTHLVDADEAQMEEVPSDHGVQNWPLSNKVPPDVTLAEMGCGKADLQYTCNLPRLSKEAKHSRPSSKS